MDSPREFDSAFVAEIKDVFDDLSYLVHYDSVNKGFWPIRDDGTVNVGARNKGEMIALMHSELSEALEGVRKEAWDDHLPMYNSEEVEMADTVIRILDYCFAFDIPLGEVIVKKLEYNRARPYKHGKMF